MGENVNTAEMMKYEVSFHPPTIYISSGLSLVSSLLIIYFYFAHSYLRTLFFNTFVMLISLGVLQFIVLVTPMDCWVEGFFMYFILTFNNCVTALIVWLLYAFVQYGQKVDVEHDISDQPHNEVQLNTIASQSNVEVDQSSNATQMKLGQHLSRQLSFKHKLGDVRFELTLCHKIFWYSFIGIVPITVTFIGYFDDFYGPWTPWCFIMFLQPRVLYYHGQVYLMWLYYLIMWSLICLKNRQIQEQNSWQTMAMKSFLVQLFCRLIFMTVSLTRCSSDWIGNFGDAGTLKVNGCDAWCYFVGFCTPLSLSFLPCFQWLWIHRDMIGYLLCKKADSCKFCETLFWWDEKYDHDDNDNKNVNQ